MITYSSLTGLPFSFLKNVFNQAFSDYTIPMNLNEEQIKDHLLSNDYDPKLSIGAFDGDKMVGFVFVGHRGNRLYDAGTAVIKEYRRQGIAKAMIKEITSKLKENEEFILECINTNERGMALYKSLGFKNKRHFICFKLQGDGELSKCVSITDSFDNKKCYSPSWQNEKINNNAITFKHQNNYLCVRPNGGVYFSDPDLTLIKHALNYIGKLSFTNVDSKDFLVNLLYYLGATVIAEQEEMSYENN